jgi:hypothetical protein
MIVLVNNDAGRMLMEATVASTQALFRTETEENQKSSVVAADFLRRDFNP